MQYPREIEELLTEVKQLQNNAVQQLFKIFILLAFTCYFFIITTFIIAVH